MARNRSSGMFSTKARLWEPGHHEDPPFKYIIAIIAAMLVAVIAIWWPLFIG